MVENDHDIIRDDPAIGVEVVDTESKTCLFIVRPGVDIKDQPLEEFKVDTSVLTRRAGQCKETFSYQSRQVNVVTEGILVNVGL
jgi:hypothetical protein